MNVFINHYLGKALMALGLSIFLALFGFEAFAKTATIFEIRKNLQLSDDEPVYHDFYINAGSQDGLKPGMNLVVNRMMTVGDNTISKISEQIKVPVAKLKLIHVQSTVCVARVQSSLLTKSTPLLNQDGIMVGDRIDLASAGPDEGDKADDKSGEKTGEKSGDRSGDKSAESKEFKEPVAVKLELPEKNIPKQQSVEKPTEPSPKKEEILKEESPAPQEAKNQKEQKRLPSNMLR